jgi:hypothetical protein
MINDFSLYEDNLGSSKVHLECSDFSKNYTASESDFWEARKKNYLEELSDEKLNREYVPYVY